MTHRPEKLDYAAPSQNPGRAGRHHLIVAGCCFGVSWLVWLGVAIATFDSFDDTWLNWALFLVGLGGTLSGIVVFVIVHVIMQLVHGD